MLKLNGISRAYDDKIALNGIDLTFPDKGLVIIKGESGSGKTTLLNLLTAHDYPTSGKITFDGVEINRNNSEKYRKAYCSNIYQDYMLIEDMTVGENIELALQAYGKRYTQEDIKTLLAKVGISEEYMTKQASKLSGGEKQRVSIARAIAKDNAMVFADEPTGNLDSQNGEIVMEILKDISKERLVVVVSHNEVFNVKYADYTVELVDGVVESSNLPQIEEEAGKEKGKLLKSKSRLKFKELIKLSSWGFKKNRAKAVISVVAFVMLSILSLIFTVCALCDVNLSYSKSLSKCDRKNFMANIINSTCNAGDIDRFEKSLDNRCSEVYNCLNKFNIGKIDLEASAKFSERYQLPNEKHSYTGNLPQRFIPYICYGIVYNPQISVDVEILHGEFPKAYNDIMLPYCLAWYMSEACVDYKTDDVRNLIGREIKYIHFGGDIGYRICGIFDEGMYYTDFKTPQSKNIVKYYNDTNIMGISVILAPDVKEFWYNNACRNGSVELYGNNYIGDRDVLVYGYDKFSGYAANYDPLADNEVYIDRSVALALGINVGDILSNTKYSVLNSDDGRPVDKNFDGLIVKGIFDLPEYGKFVIFSSNYFINNFIMYSKVSGLNGFYFNLKGNDDNYGFLNKITAVGYEENIWQGNEIDNNIDGVNAENLFLTTGMYASILGYRYIAFLPLCIIAMLGLVTMGFVSTNFLISSKGDSYNILRALGFGRGSIALIISIQVFALIALGCVFGISISAVGCQLFSKAYAKSKLGIAAKLSSEVLLPIGYVAPLIAISISVLTGIVLVVVKTYMLFSKSLIENKNN